MGKRGPQPTDPATHKIVKTCSLSRKDADYITELGQDSFTYGVDFLLDHYRMHLAMVRKINKKGPSDD